VISRAIRGLEPLAYTWPIAQRFMLLRVDEIVQS
jgi:hypothetical protein